MKKALQQYYIVLMAGLIVLPVLLFALFGRFLDTQNYENRTLAQMPSLTGEERVSIEEYPSAFEEWFNENLPFRNQLITLNGLFD